MMKEKPPDSQISAHGSPNGEEKDEQKGVVFKVGVLGAISWQAEEQTPLSWYTSVTGGVTLHFLPCHQITARHYRDCHTAHHKQLLNIPGSRA